MLQMSLHSDRPVEAHIKEREVVVRKWQFRLRCNFPGGMYREDALVRY